MVERQKSPSGSRPLHACLPWSVHGPLHGQRLSPLASACSKDLSEEAASSPSSTTVFTSDGIAGTTIMHYLHPRSRTTGTLFTTTLAISFAVVALPHLLPCPVDRRQFADSYETPDGRIVRRRKKRCGQDEGDGNQNVESISGASADNRPQRECPVPKPGGIVGQIMGFTKDERQKPKEVIVRSLQNKRQRDLPNDPSDVP
ncbi:hypothetical protein AC579_9759 [Pseudocercospora musae]|uniref:Uncharacterized protein n=1 Tax=Pseudocercospora musae TaxID=113226 RepID=A0A139IG14_9PEZI|nr:hypothetical protein AC579_9759 [Pseudocercospora musae]